jgi:SAM-dependent methyltransferase
MAPAEAAQMDMIPRVFQSGSGDQAAERIEILSTGLLDQNRPLVNELKTLARSLRLEFGWHYLLDMAWTIQNLGQVEGKTILDAGAGTGIMQWYLAEAGAEVLSVDRLSRADLPVRFRNRFRARGLRAADLHSRWQALRRHLNRPIPGPLYRRWAARLLALVRDLVSFFPLARSNGSVVIYNQDLNDLADIPGGSLDAAVAISSLEHNTSEGLEMVVREIMRVLKPGGVLLATLTAARDRDWWHAASSGWCYTDASLRRLFDLPLHTPSNYDRYDELFAALRDCAELRDNLARFYSQADDKGMPKGVWNPEYQPVGVCKIKKA